MKKRNLLTVVAAFAISTIALVYMFAPFVSSADLNKQTVNRQFFFNNVGEQDQVTQAVVAEETEYTDDELAEKFASMLHINKCFNSGFDACYDLINCSAISMNDYIFSFDGYDNCISTCLLTNFIDNFYGKTVNFDDFDKTLSPNGYISVDAMGYDTAFYDVISIKESDSEYTVIAKMDYYTHDMTKESALVRAEFKTEETSDFGFNLLSCDIL